MDQGVSLARELVQNDSQLKPTASPWSAIDTTQRPVTGIADFPLPRRSHDLASQSSRDISPLPSGKPSPAVCGLSTLICWGYYVAICSQPVLPSPVLPKRNLS